MIDDEDLAHRNTAHRNHHPMPGLLRIGRFVGAHFAAPRIAADRSDFFLVDPFGRLEREPRRISAGVASPVLGALTLPEHARAYDDKITAADFYTLSLGGFIQVGPRDRHSLVECFDTGVLGDVE